MDIQYLLWLQNLREAAGPLWEKLLSSMADFSIGAVAVLLLPAILYWSVHKETGQLLFLNFGASYTLNQTLKNTFCVSRPWVQDPRIHPSSIALEEATGFSLPSGHAAASTSIFGTLGIQLRKKAIWATALFFFYTVVVAFARNYLGVHTPQDVLVGMAESWLLIWLSYKALNWIKVHPEKDLSLLIGWVLFLIAYLLFITLRPYSAAVDAIAMQVDCFKASGITTGLVAGWFFERRFVKFSMDATTRQRVFRSIFGVALTLGLYEVLKLVLSPLDERLMEFLVKALTYFIAVFLVPFLFQRFEHRTNQTT